MSDPRDDVRRFREDVQRLLSATLGSQAERIIHQLQADVSDVEDDVVNLEPRNPIP